VNYKRTANSFIQFWKTFKQLHSNLANNIQALHLNLHTIRSNCANSNSLSHS